MTNKGLYKSSSGIMLDRHETSFKNMHQNFKMFPYEECAVDVESADGL